jgi:hypothetical protein
MSKKAFGDAAGLNEAAQQIVNEMMGELQKVHSGERGDRAVAYRQKDHWAFLSLHAMAEARQKVAFNFMKQMAARLDALEAAATKSAPALAYRGVFAEGEQYAPGEIVTAGGSMWHCNEATGERPGEGAKVWTLCVKRGRDGKDLTKGEA